VGKWIELYTDLSNKHEYIRINPPATQQQIENVEEAFGNKLPSDIRDLLLEMNGDGWLIFSTEQIIEINLECRRLDFYMPLDCLLFFGGNGCGDYYGFPITLSGCVRDDNVYMWEHESDNRIWTANNLEDTIQKYFNNEI
jgi:hypothetical protein